MQLHLTEKGMKTTMLGIGVSLALVVVKAVAGYAGHSFALIADATETGTDVVSSLLLWFGLRIAVKPADSEHPYGHGKAEPLSAIMISFFLIGAALWIAFHAALYIRIPHPVPKAFTLWILLGVLLVKEMMYRYVNRIGIEIQSQAVQADAMHHRSDAIASLAAFIGVFIAVIKGKGFESADDWAALIASGVIIYNATNIMRPAVAEIMDAAPPAQIVNKVRQLAYRIDEVKRVEKCYVRKMGVEYFVDMHIEVDGTIPVTEGHRIAHLVKDALLSSDLRIKNAIVHIEPYAT